MEEELRIEDFWMRADRGKRELTTEAMGSVLLLVVTESAEGVHTDEG